MHGVVQKTPDERAPLEPHTKKDREVAEKDK